MTSKIFFVTGATGFLGGRLCEILLEKKFRVIAFGRNKGALNRIRDLGAEIIQGDLTDSALLLKSIPEGAVVVHCGALSSAWGKYNDFYQANVAGTESVVSACLANRVNRLIHISTPSIYVAKGDREAIQESDSLPSEMINDYAHTKRIAEEKVQEAVRLGLSAYVLRPQGIIGPGDTSIMPRILRVAKRGKLPIIGSGENQIDLTYVDNVVHAILCASEVDSRFSGSVYNITNDEPVNNYQSIRRILKGLDIPVREKRIRFGFAWGLATLLEYTYRIFRLSGEPLLTRYSVCTLAFTRTLSIEKAKRELGYSPLVSLDEGIERYMRWYRKSES